MPFKIVQSIEKGNTVLSCVPQQWECDGILYWPRKQHYKLQRDEKSQPDETWQQFNCILKRQNIKSYRDGINEIDIMSNDSETDDNYTIEVAKKARKCVEIQQQSFNIMAEECFMNNKEAFLSIPQAENAAPSDIMTSHEIENNKESFLSIPEVQNPEPSQIVTTHEIETSSQLHLETVDLKTMQDDIKNIKEMQITINSNQLILGETLNTALLNITEIQVKLEKFISKSLTEKKISEVGLQPIKNLIELKAFEERLDDPRFREDMQIKLGALCTKGAGHGTTNSYSIIDLIFERNFLKMCSWTGVSRLQKITPNKPAENVQTQEKFCFKSFTKMISFFFDIIHKSDETYKFPECQKFFKTILRNATVRCKEFQQRASTKKVRKAKKKENISSENVTDATQEPLPSTSRQPLVEQQVNILLDEVNNLCAEET